MLAFQRLVGLFPRVGQKTAQKIWRNLGDEFDASRPESREALKAALPTATRAHWAKIEPILTAFSDEGLSEDPGEIIHRFAEAFYERYCFETFENAERRGDDIRELILFCSKYESCESFLNEVALLTNVDTNAGHPDDEESIHLSTVHQAKGLEYPVVFILWLAEGLFPSARSLNEDGGEAEERRLFYVATTRAKDELYLCVPHMRRTRDGGVNYLSPSRFVAELSPDLFHRAQIGRM